MLEFLDLMHCLYRQRRKNPEWSEMIKKEAEPKLTVQLWDTKEDVAKRLIWWTGVGRWWPGDKRDVGIVIKYFNQWHEKESSELLKKKKKTPQDTQIHTCAPQCLLLCSFDLLCVITSSNNSQAGLTLMKRKRISEHTNILTNTQTRIENKLITR